MRAVVFAAGQVDDYDRVRGAIGQVDLVICADGGVRHALALGLTPDLVLGDFDSTTPAMLAEVTAKGIPVSRVPTEKDETDTHLALEAAVQRGATAVLLVGGLGGRLDHTLSNLLLLPALPRAVSVTVIDDRNTVRLLKPGERLAVSGQPGEFLSLLPLSPEVRGVVVEGVKWPLEGATLKWGMSVGVSNQLVGREAFVAVREGFLLVISSTD